MKTSFFLHSSALLREPFSYIDAICHKLADERETTPTRDVGGRYRAFARGCEGDISRFGNFL